MKILTKFACLSLLMLGFTACGDSASKDLAKQLKSSYDKDGQQVELKGYISLSRVQTVTDGTITIELDNVAGQSDGELGKIKLQFGQEANQIYLPENFKSSDLEIYDNEGNKHGYLTEVKITGTVKYTDKDWKEFIDTEIESSESIKPNDPARGMKLKSIENKKKSKQKAQERADKREKETGDPNDYSFYIVGEKIEIP